jgi:hypothetical protein
VAALATDPLLTISYTCLPQLADAVAALATDRASSAGDMVEQNPVHIHIFKYGGAFVERPA